MVDDWTFDVEEISANVYRVTGHDRFGHRVEITGVDPDALLDRCKEDAAELSRAVAEDQ
jgi:hypothetical protein